MSGTATASGDSPERLDVSDVSGRVALTELVDDPGSGLVGGTDGAAFDGADPTDVQFFVEADTEEITSEDIKCDLGCCCTRLTCSSECDVCYCYDCGDPDCTPSVA